MEGDKMDIVIQKIATEGKSWDIVKIISFSFYRG